MNATPNGLSQCDDMGVCLMHAQCHRREECAATARNLPRDLPRPTGALEDEPLFHSEYAYRICWVAFCISVGVLAFLATAGLLWYFDAPLPLFVRDLVSHVYDALVRMYWADANLHY